MKIAITADLHWGLAAQGDRCTQRLAQRVRQLAPDVFVLLGDTGVEEELGECLALFESLRGVKLLVAGNHCLWSHTRGIDSMKIYREVIPATAQRLGFHYLDEKPWLAQDHTLAIVGNISWYDYSCASPALAEKYPGVEAMYRRKEFFNGQHNDGQYVRLGMSDAEFTQYVLARLKTHLDEMSQRAETLLAAIHHPPFPELFYPIKAKPSDDELMWLAYTSNRAIAELLPRYSNLRYVFCGHTHSARAASFGAIRAYNIGGNYDWKRLAVLELPAGEVAFEIFR
mgnify:CR=1 FL=1